MSGVLQKIPKIHAQLIPPQTAVTKGSTPDGKQLWYEEIPMSRSVPRILPGSVTPETPKGVQEWKKDLAGQGIYPLRQREDYIWKRLYYLESQGNNNVEKVDYVPPTKEHLAAIERARRVVAMKDSLAEALVDGGVTPENLVATLQAGQVRVPVEVEEVPETVGPVVEVTTAAAEPTAEVEVVEMVPEVAVAPEPVPEPVAEKPEVPEVTYPVMYAPGRWKLSDGSKLQGKKVKAVRAEKALQKAEK